MKTLKKKNLALCIDAGEYEGVSLFAMKIYEFIPVPRLEFVVWVLEIQRRFSRLTSYRFYSPAFACNFPILLLASAAKRFSGNLSTTN